MQPVPFLIISVGIYRSYTHNFFMGSCIDLTYRPQKKPFSASSWTKNQETGKLGKRE